MTTKMRMITMIVIAVLTTMSCQSNEEPLQRKAQDPELPEQIRIVSAEEIPEESSGITTRATSTNLTVNDIVGTYNGLLYDVEMNNNPKNDVSDVKIDITTQGANKFKFYLQPFRVGSMPGTLHVEIDNLILNANGSFYADEQNDYNLLKEKLHIVAWFGHLKYNVTLIDGSFIPVVGGYKLMLTLESRGTIIGIEIFKAHVKYTGNR